MQFADYLVLIAYFFILILIGYLSSKRIKKQEDYFMGGRSFGKLLQTFAAFGAGTGSSDPVTTGRTTFTSGMSGMWSVMYWLFVTPFYWITGVWYRRMRHLTLGDWFVERYESQAMGAAYCCFGILFFMVYGSMFFSAIGKVSAALMGIDSLVLGETTIGIEYVLVPVIGFVVLVYGIAGGLRAAYFTDLLQGICIIFLSIMLIPFGLEALVERFGTPEDTGMMAGFRILHEQLPEQYFEVIGSTSSSEFPIHRILAVVLINLIGIVVQPHFIATGGGSAKTETTARVGLVVGNFLKRFCTVGWVLTGLIAVTLFANANYPELVEDPDRAWGVASSELLSPGLRGLMLACLLAALMSSVDAYMIVGSGLVVRNLYAPYVNAHASEREYLIVGRLTGGLIVLGAVLISLFIMDVFQQLQLTWVFGVLFAAPFWIGMYWRRATRRAAWITVAYCAAFFFLIPWLAPIVSPELRTSEGLTRTNDRVTTVVARDAAPVDVLKRDARIALWDRKFAAVAQARQAILEAREARGSLAEDTPWAAIPPSLANKLAEHQPLSEQERAELQGLIENLPNHGALAELARQLDQLQNAQQALAQEGKRPTPITAGDRIYDRNVNGGQFIFWASGQQPADANVIAATLVSGDLELTVDYRRKQVRLYDLRNDPTRQVDLSEKRSDVVAELQGKIDQREAGLTQTGETLTITERMSGTAKGLGNLKLDLYLYQAVGIDLRQFSDATLATLELPAKIVTPFLVMIICSCLTRPNSQEALDHYYCKMKTPVDPNPERDREALYFAYQKREELEKRKLFPGTSLEFQKPTWVDALGFIVCFAVCFAIIGLAVWVTQLGR